MLDEIQVQSGQMLKTRVQAGSWSHFHFSHANHQLIKKDLLGISVSARMYVYSSSSLIMYQRQFWKLINRLNHFSFKGAQYISFFQLLNYENLQLFLS